MKLFGYTIIKPSKLLHICGILAKFVVEKLKYNNCLSMQIQGRVIQSLGVEGGTSKAGKEWHRGNLLIEVTENPQYPKRIKISNMKKAEEFSKIPIGTDVIFSVEIESREFNERWYTDVSCWKWEIQQNQQPMGQPYQQPYQQPYAQTGYPPQMPYGQTQGQVYQPQPMQSQFPTAQPLPEGTTENSDDLPF